MNNKKRQGRFTSSKIHTLIPLGSRPMTEEELVKYKEENPKGRKKNIAAGFSAPGLTYIEEKNIERKMKRCIDTDAYSQSMAWGQFMELVVFQLLGLEYRITSKQSDLHPSKEFSDFWAGSNDAKVEGKRIAEIKAYQPKKFAKYAEVIMSKDIDRLRNEFPQEYWQIVSNCAIHKVPNGEAILYMPYESEMEAIREMARNYEGADKWKYRFIEEKSNDELAVLPNNGYYKNINIFEFEVPKEDIKLLEDRVREASKLLITL